MAPLAPGSGDDEAGMDVTVLARALADAAESTTRNAGGEMLTTMQGLGPPSAADRNRARVGTW